MAGISRDGHLRCRLFLGSWTLLPGRIVFAFSFSDYYVCIFSTVPVPVFETFAGTDPITLRTELNSSCIHIWGPFGLPGSGSETLLQKEKKTTGRVPERKKVSAIYQTSSVSYIVLIIATVPYFSVGFLCMPCRERNSLKWNELPNTVKLSLLSKKPVQRHCSMTTGMVDASGGTFLYQPFRLVPALEHHTDDQRACELANFKSHFVVCTAGAWGDAHHGGLHGGSQGASHIQGGLHRNHRFLFLFSSPRSFILVIFF